MEIKVKVDNESIRKLIANKEFEDIAEWDTSEVTDMSELFLGSEFNVDISNWDVSNVTNMKWMFCNSQFNGDISGWNVSNVTDMGWMFNYNSQFNRDISRWDVSNVTDMSGMFCYSQFNGDISCWNVKGVTDMRYMFYGSQFNGDISRWNVKGVTDMSYMFYSSPFDGDISSWDIKEEIMDDILDSAPQYRGLPPKNYIDYYWWFEGHKVPTKIARKIYLRRAETEARAYRLLKYRWFIPRVYDPESRSGQRLMKAFMNEIKSIEHKY